LAEAEILLYMKRILFCLFLFSNSITYAQSHEILVPYRAGDKWGYSDTLGSIKIPPGFDSAEPFEYNDHSSPDQAYAIVSAAGMKSVINLQGKLVLSGKFEEVEINYLVNGVSFIVQNGLGKRGVYTPAKLLVPVVHDYLNAVRNDSYIVSKDDKYGLINSQGKLILPVEYDDIRESHNDDEKDFEWKVEKEGETKTIKDNRIVRTESGVFVPPVIISDDAIPETDANWKADLANKWKADSMVMANLEGHNSLWILYRKNQQAIFFEYSIPEELSFFDTAYKIKNVYQLYAGMPDHEKYNASFLIHVGFNGKEGLVTEKNKVIIPASFDTIRAREEFDALELVKDGKLGLFIFNTIYPYIPPRYDNISKKNTIIVDGYWHFGIYQVVRKDKTFYLGENGVEYFK
jgi:hypothetical protein